MRHRLIETDPAARTGICQQCGSTDIRQRSGRWRCATALREYDRNSQRQRKRRVLSNRNGGYIAITHAEIFRRMVAQKGLCALCGKKPKKLVVDHDHDTGKIRQLLCWSCNSAIGFAGDDPALLRKMAEYIEGYRE